jgi:1,4-alpha-glucan branching enzyme
MWAHPGKQLLFMGGELAQENEWAHDRSLDWHLLDRGEHRGVHDLVRELNRVSAAEPALYVEDFSPEGFHWIDADDRDHSVYSFLRFGSGPDGAARPVACIANLTPVPRHGYRIGLPTPGRWVEIVNSDDGRWGGSGVVNGETWTDDLPWQGSAQSALLTLPPLGVVWLTPE